MPNAFAPVDTHSHVWRDAASGARASLLEAKRAGVGTMILASVGPADWSTTQSYARTWGLPYMLGIHPFSTAATTEEDLVRFEKLIERSLEDPLFIGIGEVGLDGICVADAERSEAVFAYMLRTARRWDLPLSVHVRRSASRLLYWMHRAGLSGTPGVMHAFNGSTAEREAFRRLGFRMGFGGSLTYAGSLRIRRHLEELDDEGWVLETDAPDMPNARRRLRNESTYPVDLMSVLAEAARIRHVDEARAASDSRRNALAAFPRLQNALSVSSGEWSILE